MQKLNNIFIVDDNKELAHNLNDILTKSGYATTVALDGKSAIELCRKKGFDIAIIYCRQIR